MSASSRPKGPSLAGKPGGWRGITERLARLYARVPAPSVGLLAGAAAFVVYLLTLAPTVMSNDVGRFQVAAPLLGTGHPTGYPTFILLGHLFTYLPFGDVAYRINLLAAVSGAVAVGLFVPVARALGASVLPAAGMALLYAFSGTFWSQATVGEVYALHAAFVLAVLLLMLRWRERRGTEGGGGWDLAFAGLLYGLAAGNNAGTVLLAPALLVLLVAGRPPVRQLLGAGGAFLVGLSVYLYVPVRGFAGAWHNYGDPVRNWAEAWLLVSGARFRGLLDLSPASLSKGARGFWAGLFGQAQAPPLSVAVGLILVVGGLCGAVLLLRRSPATGFAVCTALGTTLLYAMGYRIADVAVYRLPVYLFLALLSALAITALARRLARRFVGHSWLLVPLLAAPLALAGLAVSGGFEEHDRGGDYSWRLLAEEALAGLPEGAVLYGRADIIPVTYLKEVEGERGDVTLRWADPDTLGKHFGPDLGSGRPVYFLSDPLTVAYLKGEEDRFGISRKGRLIQILPKRDDL